MSPRSAPPATCATPAAAYLMELPLGFFTGNQSGQLRKIIDDNAALTEDLLAHKLPDLTAAVVTPAAAIVLLFVFDWRMGLLCLLTMACMMRMMGGKNAGVFHRYQREIEKMSGEAVEYVRGIPVVKDAPIVVPDEATAFAAPESEALIQKAFTELTRGKTVLMIAHRLSTVKDADQIFVIEKGSVKERGNHSELLAQQGLYAKMWQDYRQAAVWKVGKEAEV